jgi:hypothetical protein
MSPRRHMSWGSGDRLSVPVVPEPVVELAFGETRGPPRLLLRTGAWSTDRIGGRLAA